MAPPAPGSRLSTQGNTGVNSSGAREAANNFLLDGADNNDQFLNRLVINPSLDAIEELTLLQNTYDAQYGRSAGAQVNMVLKSGLGLVRGSLYEFFRHSSLAARNAVRTAGEDKPLLQRHQSGGTLGGPLQLPRSFFFVNVEGIDGQGSGHAAGPRADRRRARRAISAPRRRPFAIRHRPAVSRQPDSGLADQRRGTRGREPLSAAQPRGPASPTSSRLPSADRTAVPVHGQDGSHHLARQPRRCATASAATIATCRFPPERAISPASGCRCWIRGSNFGVRADPRAVGTDVQRAARRRQCAAPREPAAERRHRPVRGARHHRASDHGTPTSGFPHWWSRATKRWATIPTCPSSATRHVPRRRTR